MTVVVWKDGVLAADSGGFRGAFIVADTIKKVVRTPAGCLVAGAGGWRFIDRFRKWAMEGFPEATKPPVVEKEDDLSVIVAHPDGRVEEWGHDMIPEDCSHEAVVTVGCGHEFVFALATLGWSAEQIVAHTIKHCTWAIGEVHALRLDGTETEAVAESNGVDPDPMWFDEEAEPREDRAFLTERGLGGPKI